MRGTTIIYFLIILGVASTILWWGNRITYVPSFSPEILSEDDRFVLTTDTWAIFDLETGEVREGNNTERITPIASITKLFTAYAALQSPKLDTPTVINWNDLYTEGRSGKLSHGEVITPRELLFPLLIESSNDAGTAIQERLGSDFDSALEGLRTELSLSHTYIVDGSGLSPQNVSTPTELSRAFAYIRKTEPHIVDITRLRMYLVDDNGWINNDPAREFEEFIGGKHGFTYEAGRTLVAGFKLESGEEFGLVLLGSEDLHADIKSVIAYVKENQK